MIPDPANPTYQRIWATVDCVPRGRVATYGQIAREAGLAGRARQVGYALRNLPAGSALPWHRVLNAQGRISVRTASGRPSPEQRRRLRAEGVALDARGRVDLGRFGWRPE
ncbi:MAG: MGMT family protein [Planctomycetota bacterium]